MKTPEQLEEEIEALLRGSHRNDRGPHGRTILAVMKRVRTLRRIAKPGPRVFVKVPPRNPLVAQR